MMARALLLLAAAAAIVAAVWASRQCQPGDQGLYLGRTMLLSGCPEPR